jgi:haloalkane dehalogenase
VHTWKLPDLDVVAIGSGRFRVVETLRTPDHRFADLVDFRHPPRHCDVDDDEGGRLRVA